jgi:hypothetical protein
MISESYELLAEALLDEVEAALALRASRHRERRLEELATTSGAGAGLLRFASDRVLVRPTDGAARFVQLGSAEASAAISGLPAASGLGLLAGEALELRRHAALLMRRRRLRDRLHTLGGQREALQRLRESEIADADAARRRLLKARARVGEAPGASLTRPVATVVLEQARRLLRAVRETELELLRADEELATTSDVLDDADRAILAHLRALVPLTRECVRLEYQPLRQRLLSRYRRLALATEGASPDRARSFLRDLAFLMAKANFFPLDRETLERGFELGPAPGVRLRVPLEDFSFACFFARGERMEPTHHGRVAPHFAKFAFCLLERDLTATTEDAPPRRRPRPTWIGRLRERQRRWWHSRRRRLAVAWSRRHRRLIAPRIDRVTGYLARLAPVPPADVAVDPALKLKLFRDVRLGEAGLVLPGARIRYRIFDLLLVWGGAAGGFLAKLLQKPLAVLFAPKLFFSLLAALVGRGLLGLRRSRTTLDRLQESYENRHLQATRMHTVHFFVREAVRTDAKEMLLAYGLGLRAALERDASPVAGGFTVDPARVRKQAEAFLREHFRDGVGFDVADAVGGLEALGVVPRPGALAPGPDPPDYFDERLLGQTYHRAAIARLVEQGGGSAADAPVSAAAPDTAPGGPRPDEAPPDGHDASPPGSLLPLRGEALRLARWLERGADRAAEQRSLRDADRPCAGRRPLTNEPWWLPPHDAQAGEPRPWGLSGEVPMLGPGAALESLRSRARSTLGLEGPGDP